MIATETRSLGILARWYAEPLSHDAAKTLLKLCAEREQLKLKQYGSPYLAPYLKLIALHWLDEPTDGHYQYLRSRNSVSAHAEVLKPLIYGQLLISKKIEGAIEYLDEAFQQGRLLFRPEDYFVVMKRHQLLAKLPTGDHPSHGEGLNSLLTTAAVIDRMGKTQQGRPDFDHDPNDTYG